jgi:CRP/FNR family transcriptional regulator, cyclic AMP receptor protein
MVIVMLETIQESELFTGVTPRILTEIANGSEEVTFHEGATIFRKGEISQDIYELIEGSVDLMALNNEVVHLTVSRGGQIFGWSALVEPYKRTATARCATEVRTIRISRYLIERIIEKHPHEGIAILKNLMRILADRLHEAYSYIQFSGV